MPEQERGAAPRPTRSSRQTRRMYARRRRVALLGGLGLVILVAAGAVLALSGGEEKPRAKGPAPTTTTTTAPAAPAARSFAVATTKGQELAVYEQPDPNAEKVATLDPVTAYRAPTTMLVDPTRPVDDEWLPVTVPFQKPNNTPGWVRTADVSVTQTTYEIHVQLWTHDLQLVKDGEVILRSKVIVGTKETPTPTGTFYVTDPVNCNTEVVPGYPVGQCSGAYGAFAIGTSGLSEVLDSFAGTIPQIALHGTDLPATELGKDLSNGCIRMPNEVITQIASITPLIGTPVFITLLGGQSVREQPATNGGGGGITV